MRRFIAVALITLTSTVGAQGGGRGRPPGAELPAADIARVKETMDQMRAKQGWDQAFFPPDLVMQHQSDINLQDAQRNTIQAAMVAMQTKVTGVQWAITTENEKLNRLVQGPTADENQVLEQIDRVLALEREMKRAQVTLLVKIKNTLSPAQQEKLAEFRGRGPDWSRRPDDRTP